MLAKPNSSNPFFYMYKRKVGFYIYIYIYIYIYLVFVVSFDLLVC